MYDLDTIVALNEQATEAATPQDEKYERAVTVLKFFAHCPVQAFENDLHGAVEALSVIQVIAAATLTNLGVPDELEDLNDANERSHADAERLAQAA